MNSKNLEEINVDDRDVAANPKEIITDLDKLGIPCFPCGFTKGDIIVNQLIVAEIVATIQANRATCFSLSANQIGHDKAIFVYYEGRNVQEGEDVFEVILNPRIIPLKTYGIRQYNESCMSYPDTLGKYGTPHTIRRYKKIKLFYRDIYGNPEQKVFTGKDAVMIQHEMDHINGVIR